MNKSKPKANKETIGLSAPFGGQGAFLPFSAALAPHFKSLNLAWVQKYFTIEPMDEEVLSHPKENIIDKGGHIFFALAEGEVAGTFALLKVEEGIYELGKMAVAEQYQGQGMGNRMLVFCLTKAKELGARKVILYSNTILKVALHLYKKFGFIEVPPGHSEYKRSNVKMEVDLTPGPSPLGEGSVSSRNASVIYNENLHKNASKILYQFGRELRRKATKAEELLWNHLRNSRLEGFKFRRQHPIDHYIADFYCHQKTLVVELDGSVHKTAEALDYDSARDKHFTNLGLTVLRFSNDEVEQNIKVVLQKIRSMLKQGTTHLPSPQGEGPGVRSMYRIHQLFQQKQQNILNMYCTAGYPYLDSTLKVMHAFQKNGADLIELGMPYSDPLADGPVIQASNARALQNGMTITTLFEQLKNLRSNSSAGDGGIHVPVVLMGYLNPLLQYGFEAFCSKAAEVGVDGLIIPDIPMYEFENEYKAIVEKHGLDFIFLVTPETSEERIKKLDSLSSGFLYAVSSSSTTGSDKDFSAVETYLQWLKSMHLKNPVLVGFGIKDKQTFNTVCKYVNGAIIASAYIKALEDADNVEERTKMFLEGILK